MLDAKGALVNWLDNALMLPWIKESNFLIGAEDLWQMHKSFMRVFFFPVFVYRKRRDSLIII